MKGLTCTVCSNADILTEVRVIHNSRIVYKSESGLQSYSWATENERTPFILRYTYVCNRCGYEDQKLDLFRRH